MNPLLVIIFCVVPIIHSLPYVNLELRIIGGDTAAKAQFPWQAAIYITKGNEPTWCGGALINNRWILTAGHCVQGASSFVVALGSNTIMGQDVNRVVLRTVQYIQHEHYNSMTLDNDIAVILLPEPVTFNDYIQPIALPSASVPAGTTLTVSGWGLTSDSELGPSIDLNYVDLVSISDEECKHVYGRLPTGAFCARHRGEKVQGTCEGDSGGPVVVYTSGGPVHVGIVSFGHPDGCEAGHPVAFARTDHYRNWIKLKTGV